MSDLPCPAGPVTRAALLEDQRQVAEAEEELSGNPCAGPSAAAQRREAGDERLYRGPGLHPRQRRADAGVHPVAEGEVAADLASDLEVGRVGPASRVAVAGGKVDHHVVAGPDRPATDGYRS